MKIKKVQAVAMLVALGFPKAGEWSDSQLADRMGKLPSKFKTDEIPDEFDELFDELQNSDPDVAIDLTDEKGKSINKSKAKPERSDSIDRKKEPIEKAKPKKKAAAKAKAKPAPKAKAKPAAKKKAAPKAKAKAKADPKPKAKAAPAPKAKAKAAPKKSSAEKPSGPKSPSAGSKTFREGSIKGIVFNAVKEDWTAEKDVMAEAEIPFDQARRPLYHLRKAGRIERRATGYEYRITPAK